MPAPLIVREPTQLQAFLFASFPDTKKTRLKQSLKYGSVFVNERAATQFDHPLRPGDRVEIRSKEEAQSPRLLPRGMNIHHEDDAIIVVEKPADLLSIASEAEKDETAYARLTS